MMDLALTVLAVVAGGLIPAVYAAARAPLGYQDDCGFHPGTEACPSVKPS